MTMDRKQKHLAAMIYGTGDGDRADRVLADIANHLQDQGFQLAGTVQRAAERTDRCACDMMVRDLSTGLEMQISEDRGPNARGCRLDPGKLETLVASTAVAMESGVDAVIINKFGKREAQGDGFREVIGQALLCNTPLLIGVNVAYLDSWRSFADGFADELQPEKNMLVDWINQRLDANSNIRESMIEPRAPMRAL